MARFLQHEPCPKCGSKDNLGRYDDGSCWCFGCGYYEHGDSISRIKSIRKLDKGNLVQNETPSISLPSDVDTYIPALARSWLGKYILTEYEIIHNKLLWSEYYQQLIFPYFNKYNQLEAWQGRSFKEGQRKWFSQGNMKSLYHILPPEHGNDVVVLVEDIVSAIKVSRFVPAMPVFCSTIGLDRFKTLYSRFSRVKIWLDPNMRKQSLREALIGKQLGMDVQVIFSDKDPKEHKDEEILRLVAV